MKKIIRAVIGEADWDYWVKDHDKAHCYWQTDISSNQLTSKWFAHRYSQSRHHRQSDEKQRLTYIHLRKLQVNHHNQVQRQTHQGARCQDRGQARGSGQKLFDLRPARRSKRPGRSADQGKKQNRHFEERKDTFKTLKFGVHCWQRVPQTCSNNVRQT